MEFSDISWDDIHDRLPVSPLEKNDYILWQIPYRNTLFKLRLQMIEHGVTISSKEGKYAHFNPVFTRFFIFRKGSAELILQNGIYRMTPGKIYILPSNMNFHVRYQPRELIYYHLCLDDYNGRSIFDADDSIQEIDLPELRDHFLSIPKQANNMIHWGALITALGQILPDRMEKLYARSLVEKDFTRLFKYLDRNPPAQITVEELAGLYNISPSTLSKRFQRKTGIGLKKYIEQKLLRQACEHLLFSSLKIIDIAKKLGYSDPAYFYNFFRKQTGLTPQQFRIHHRE